MRRSIKVLVALALALTCASADLMDNQIEDQQGRRYLVKGCEPCASSECQLMGEWS